MSLLSDCNNAYDVGPNNVGYGLPYPHAGAQNTAKAACDTCVSKGEKLESMGYIDAGDCANASDQREYDTLILEQARGTWRHPVKLVKILTAFLMGNVMQASVRNSLC